MEDLASWMAPTDKMIAATMNAADLGAQVTGSGLIIFAFWSMAWSVIRLSSGQIKLIVTNGFLPPVNLIGVGRWPAKQRAYDRPANPADMIRSQRR